MANFVSRNVLICVVPAVVLLLSVYWFRKKKKMKPDILSSINTKNSCINKSNEAFGSQGSIYSPVESTSDFSNTLSDASSISSPENSQRTQSISTEASTENVVNECIEALTVANHIGELNYQAIISVTKEENLTDNDSQIENTENSEKSNVITSLSDMKQLVSSNCGKETKSNDNMQLKENVINSFHNLNTSFNDALEKCLSENEQDIKVANDNFDFSCNIQSGDTLNSHVDLEEKDQKSDISEVSITNNDTEEPVNAVKQNTFASELLNMQTETIPLKEPNIAVESDSQDSHSSVLDENSLSSVSDESEKQIDFKYKDSPSSVFDGNSVSDESEKTNVNNEHNAVHLRSSENYNDNQDCISNDVESTLCVDSNNEQYSIQLNKNSFFVKTILSNDTANEVSSSNCFQNVTNSPCLQHCNLQPVSLQSHSSEESFITVNKDDLGNVDQQNNQPVLRKEIDSSEDNNCISPVETSLACEIISLDSENIISSTSSDKICSQTEEQSKTAVELIGYETTVSSSDEIIYKDTAKVNGSGLLDSITCSETDSSSETIKAQHDVLEQSQNKVADLDMMDMKSSGVIPGLFIYEFELPQELCGRLIGKLGKHVKSIKERTNANVFIKRHPYDSNLKTVVVEGSRTAVHEALEIIRRKFPLSQFPAVTLIQTNMISSHGVSLPESLQLHLPDGASCDVILSSLLSAGHFFLQQPTHPTHPSLSTLDQCMISCYTQMNTPMLPDPVEAGVICAAPVMNGWFRAQIIYVYENRTECEIKFVDYGGFSQVSISSLRQIRSDFMTLPFQASECYLANVRPIDRNAGWSSEATAVFEELAQGQILQALLVEYAEDGIPCVHLYRVQGVSNMFINRELVERGLAVWVDNGHWDPH